MMSEFRFRIFLLVNAVAGFLSLSGAELTLKYVCPGDNVQVFKNIEINSCNAVISLFINGARNTRIATWSWYNCILNETLLPDYQVRVFRNQNGSISIRNFGHFDQGKYIAVAQADTLPMMYEVAINVMVTPSKDCKPRIIRLENRLFATLKVSECGKPVTTMYWIDNDGISRTNEAYLNLKPGKDVGTYYACIQGPALLCVRNVTTHYFCSNITTEGGKSSPIPSETSNTTVYIAVSIGFVILACILLIVVITVRRRRVNRNRRKNSEYKTEDASTKHSTDPDQVIELIEPHDDALCRMCFSNIRSVCLLPCGHMATCYNCSSSLAMCPVCKTNIKSRIKPFCK